MVQGLQEAGGPGPPGVHAPGLADTQAPLMVLDVYVGKLTPPWCPRYMFQLQSCFVKVP